MDKKQLAKILGLNSEKPPKITFEKTNFSPEKIGVEPVFNRMFLNANFKSEIARVNNDIKSAFKNLISMGVHKTELPLLSQALFENLMITIDRGNMKLLSNQSAPEFTRTELKKISETQYKIYKILYKIEEDLIDEQDTSIKNQSENNRELLDKVSELLGEKYKDFEDRLVKMEKTLREYEENGGPNGDGGSGGLDVFDVLATVLSLKGAKSLLKTPPKKPEKPKKPGKPGKPVDLKKSGERGKNPKEQPKGSERGKKPPKSKPPKVPKAPKPPETIKLNPKFAKALSGVIKILGKGLVVLDLLLLPKQIYDAYNFSIEKYPDYGTISRIVYSVVSGLTTWVKDHLTIIADIAVLLKELVREVLKGWEYLDDGSIPGFGVLVTIFKLQYWAFEFIVDKVIVKANVALVKLILKYSRAQVGDACGVTAVDCLTGSWEEFKRWAKNNVPNDTTYELIFGGNTVLGELQKKGFYEWNALGYSGIKSKYGKTSGELAWTLTVDEINAILKHGDVSENLKNELNKALNLKIKNNITDIDVRKNTYEDPYLNALYDVLDSSSAALESQWAKFIGTVTFLKKENILMDGWISLNCYSKDKTEVAKRTSGFDADNVESMFKYIFSRFKGRYEFLGYNKLSSDDAFETLYFTVYGTLLNAHFGPRPYKPVNEDPKTLLSVKVLGYIDKNREFHENKYCPSDIIMKEVLGKNDRVKIPHSNIVVDEVLRSVSQEQITTSDVLGVTSSSLPSHLAMTTGYSEPESPQQSPSLPSHLATTSTGSGGFGGSGVSGVTQESYATETHSYSGSNSVPAISTQVYSDWLSTEAIKNAKVYEKNGKWYSNNPFVDAIIQIESMRNASARPWSKKKQKYLSTAAGLFQFIDSTGERYGLHSLNDKLDPYKSLEAFKRYVLDNIKTLKSKGIPVTPATVYLCHQQGAGGLSTIYKYITGKGPFPSEYVGTMSGNTHGHPYKDPVDWFNNWSKDIAKKMAEAPNAPADIREVANAQTFPGTQSAPQDYSQSPQTQSSQAMSSVPSYIPRDTSETGTSSNAGGPGMTYAANYATQQAQKNRGSTGYCARYVANALQAAGLKFQRQGSAYMYHTRGILKQAGFGLVSVGRRGYTPQAGDVCVINKFNNHKHGHICIYNGKNWVSDFVQNNPSPYRDGPGESGMFFYRYGGADLTPTEMPESTEPYTASESYSEMPGQPVSGTSGETGSVIQTQTQVTETEGELEKLFCISIEDCMR